MKKLVLAAVFLIGSSAAAFAGGGWVYSSNTDTTGFVGIQVELGDMQPSIVGGIRHTKTDTDNDVTGLKADVALPITGSNPFVPTLRVLGLVGDREVQGEAGVGYDLATQQPLLGVGVQGYHLNVGANLQMDGKADAYVGANTLGDAPARDKDNIIY